MGASVKHECLGKLILFGEGSLKRALNEFLEHYHAERPHQGKANVIPFPTRDSQPTGDERVCCNAMQGSAACFDTSSAPHEYFR